MPLEDADAEAAPVVDTTAVAETVALFEVDDVGDATKLLEAEFEVDAVLLCDAVADFVTEAVVDAARLLELVADDDTLLDADDPITRVYIALKLEPSVLYGTTSAPRNAYDCWLASA